jgi:Sulfotransferase domain
MNKVFGIGFHKTGTKSLGRALEILGYRVCGPVGVRDPEIATKLPQIAFEYAQYFDAFQDNPWTILYPELDQNFQDSKFILTIRPVNSWIASVTKYFGTENTPMRELIYGQDYGHPVGNEARYIQRYEQHNQAVLDYFKHRPNDLLILHLTEGEGWEKLCPFLNLDVPNIIFPHQNNSFLQLE